MQITGCSLLAFKWSLLYVTAEKSLKASPTAFQNQKVNKVVAAVTFKPRFCSSACCVVPYKPRISPMQQRGLPGPAGHRAGLPTGAASQCRSPPQGAAPGPAFRCRQPTRPSRRATAAARRVGICLWRPPPPLLKGLPVLLRSFNQYSLWVVNLSLARVGNRNAGVRRLLGLECIPKAGRREGAEQRRA